MCASRFWGTRMVLFSDLARMGRSPYMHCSNMSSSRQTTTQSGLTGVIPWNEQKKNWNYSTANAFSMCKLQTEYYLTHSVVVIVVVVVVDCRINSKVYRVAHNLFDSNGCWQCAPETTNDQFDVVVWLFFFYYLASSREKLEWPKGDDIRVGFT